MFRPPTDDHLSRVASVVLVDRARHVLVVGKTGLGKSTLLRAICRADAHAGRGFLLVDPHGDLADEVRVEIPRRRRNDLVPFHATDFEACPGLNPLRNVPPEHRSLVVSSILATIRKLWPEFWGPRTEHVLRYTLLALTEVRGATLADARAMLIDEARRRWVLRQVRDPRVLSFWTQEWGNQPRAFAAEVMAPVLNKLGALLASDAAWRVLTKRRPKLDVRQAIDRGRIVLASLPKGQIGEDSALLLGGLLLGAFQSATLARADTPIAARTPFGIIVDEVGSFATDPFLGLVAEARKYAVSLVLATQSLAAMPPETRSALLGNVGTLVAFRVGAEDAEIVSREFVREFAPEHLMRLGVGEFVVRSGAKRPVLIPPS